MHSANNKIYLNSDNKFEWKTKSQQGTLIKGQATITSRGIKLNKLETKELVSELTSTQDDKSPVDHSNRLQNHLINYHLVRLMDLRSEKRAVLVKDKILLPVNLDQSGYWVLLYLIYSKNSDKLQQICYFDPKKTKDLDNLLRKATSS